MEARKYYKDVTEKMKMLQISNCAISEPILDAMQPYIAFQDVDSDLGDVIYSGLVFDEITDTLADELIDEHTLMFVTIHEMAHICTKSIGHKTEFWEN